MRIRVSAPDEELTPEEQEGIHRDLEKIERRLQDYREEVRADVRVRTDGGKPGLRVTIELNWGRNHLIAKADNGDVGQAVREAREDLLRQINDRSRRGHSSFAKGSPGRTP